jgi:hypothetical protein
MKHFIGAGALMVLALVVRFGMIQRFGLGIYVHDTIRVFPLRIIGFWFLMGIAGVWFVVAAYKLGRHST